MEKISSLPQMTNDIVDTVYNVATTTPYLFIHQTVESLGETSPVFVTSRIIDALRISHHQGIYNALMYLRGSLFIPACLDQAAQAERVSIQIARKTMDKVSGGQLPSNSELLRNIGRYNPRMAEHFGHLYDLSILENIDPQVMDTTYTKGLRAFELFERQIQEGFPLDPQEDFGIQPDASPPSVPLIRIGIINRQLIDIALIPERFTGSTNKEIQDSSPDLAKYVLVLSMVGGSTSLVVACLISQGIIQEYQARGLKIPWVSGNSIGVISNENLEILKKSQETKQQPGIIHSEEMRNFMAMSAKENPHLWRSFDLLKGLLHFNQDIISFAAYYVYKAWRNQIVADYWEDISSKNIPEPEY